MMYYTGNNQIKELMTSIADVEVKDLGTLESLTNVSLVMWHSFIHASFARHHGAIRFSVTTLSRLGRHDSGADEEEW